MAEPLTDQDRPLAPDPEVLIRSDNPWDWLLASFLGLGEGEVEAGQPAPAGQANATRPTRRAVQPAGSGRV